MTTFAANNAAAAAPWMSRVELAQASGLREDLVARFIPATDTPNGPMYPAQQMALAVYVKELTDHNLPGMSGTELARALEELRPDLPVVVTSGVVSRADEPTSGNVRGWLAKPYSDRALSRMIASALGRV